MTAKRSSKFKRWRGFLLDAISDVSSRFLRSNSAFGKAWVHTAEAKIGAAASPHEAATYVLAKSVPNVLLPLLRSQSRARGETVVDIAEQLCDLIGRSLVCFVMGESQMSVPFQGEKEVRACFRAQPSKLSQDNFEFIFKTLIPSFNTLKLHTTELQFASAVAYFLGDTYKNSETKRAILSSLLLPGNNRTVKEVLCAHLHSLARKRSKGPLSESSRIMTATLLLHAGAPPISGDLIQRAAKHDGSLFGLLTQWCIYTETERVVRERSLQRSRDDEASRTKLRRKKERLAAEMETLKSKLVRMKRDLGQMVLQFGDIVLAHPDLNSNGLLNKSLEYVRSEKPTPEMAKMNIVKENDKSDEEGTYPEGDEAVPGGDEGAPPVNAERAIREASDDESSLPSRVPLSGSDFTDGESSESDDHPVLSPIGSEAED